MKAPVVVDIMREVVQATASAMVATLRTNEAAAAGDSGIIDINYQHGHRIDLVNKLQAMNADPNAGAKKYPLVWLVQDFDEERGRETGVYADVRINIVIGHYTSKDYLPGDRYEKVFKPVLYPLYEALLLQLARHPLVVNADAERIPHIKTDRLYWGKQSVGGNEANAVNDHVDAIDIQNMELRLRFKTC